LRQLDAKIKIVQEMATGFVNDIKTLSQKGADTTSDILIHIKDALKKTKQELKTLKAEAKIHYNTAESIFSKKMNKALTDTTSKLDTLTADLTNKTDELFSKIDSFKQKIKEARINNKLLSSKIKDKENILTELHKAKNELPKTNDDIPAYTQNVSDKANEPLDDIIPESIDELLAARENAEQALDDLDVEDDMLDDSMFQDIHTQERDPFLKVADEIKTMTSTIKTIDDIRALPLATGMPRWLMDKVLISPIGKLSVSPNDFVRGLASKLHESTIHTGFVEQHNASVVRKELDTLLNRLFHEVISDWKQYKLTTNPGTNLEEYNELVINEAYNVISNIQHNATVGIDGGISAVERAKIINSRMSAATKQFTENLDPTIKLSVERTLKYFEGIHARGKGAGLKSFIDSAGQGYLPRSYNLDKINKMSKEKAIEYVYDAQVKYASLTNRVVTEDVLKEFREIAEGTINIQYDAAANYGRTVTAIENGKGITGPLHQRTIQALDSDLLRILDTNLENTLVKYQT